jgi:outer membrane lipoprotein carrier protein
MNKLTVITGLSIWLVGMAFALSAPASAQQATSTDALLQRLAGITHIQGEFQQFQYGDNEVLLAESSGFFKLLRPTFFSWEIRSPDQQLVIANQEFLWHYDIDLQTVTRRPIAGNVEASPLQVLAGDESVLREQYTVVRDDADNFTLVPLGDAQGFKRLAVRFDGSNIVGMDILDKLNQHVKVSFSKLDSSSTLSAADFDFAPPQGDVDLFYYDE